MISIYRHHINQAIASVDSHYKLETKCQIILKKDNSFPANKWNLATMKNEEIKTEFKKYFLFNNAHNLTCKNSHLKCEI